MSAYQVEVSEMTVNELAIKLKIAPDTVRYYTRIGLLTPQKATSNGYRQYSSTDEKRLRFAMHAKLLGFTLRDIQQILEHAETGLTPCPLVRNLIVRRVKEVREHLQDAQTLLSRMEEALRQWEQAPDRVPSGDSICHLVEDVESYMSRSISSKSQLLQAGSRNRSRERQS